MTRYRITILAILAAVSFYVFIVKPADEKPVVDLSREQVEEIVRRSYQYVAMYNVNNKFALDPTNPLNSGGWNRLVRNTELADHTFQSIPRPNNDTFYMIAMLDLRAEPLIIEVPPFDSKYVSLMATGYDHYVNIPMSKRLGDFSESSRILFYTERTRGYSGEPVPGVDKIVEMTGDFVSAVYRLMPHANEPERLQRIVSATGLIKLQTLSEFQQDSSDTTSDGLDRMLTDVAFPDFGRTDFDVFENNLLEVMQFVFNHTSFDPADELDQSLLAVYAPLGVVPGREFDPDAVADIDGAMFREVAESVASWAMDLANDPAAVEAMSSGLFQPKGQMDMDLLVGQSVIGPIGQPAQEAIYVPVLTSDGARMNATQDYVIRMQQENLPPATAFWSATLYDTENGFFIPNAQKKYSVGENSGYQLDANGGIAIYIAAEQPAGAPDENWLPINRGDYGIDVVMRLYAPDLERYREWVPPKAERQN